MAQALDDQATVGQVGQRIMESELTGLFFVALALGDVEDDADETDDLGIVIKELGFKHAAAGDFLSRNLTL
jgi:hypothetical protein